MNRENDAPSVPRRRGGFTLAEMLLAIAVLALFADLIGSTVTFGVQYFQRRMRYSQAVILLDTLCAVVRNDLTYATKYYADGSIERVVRDYAAQKDYAVRTWYGVGQWRIDNPDSYFDESVIQWRGIQDSAACPGQIIRKSALSGGQHFFDCVSPPESYDSAGKSGLYAALEITPIFAEGNANRVDRFSFTVTLYDAPDETAQIVAQRLDFVVLLVQPIPFVETNGDE